MNRPKFSDFFVKKPVLLFSVAFDQATPRISLSNQLGFSRRGTQFDSEVASIEYETLIFSRSSDESVAKVKISSVTFTDEQKIKRKRPRPSQIFQTLMTAEVFSDRAELRVTFQLLSADGRSKTDRNGAAVRM